MLTTPELPPRPEPPERVGDMFAAWLRWFGLGRLIAGALSVLIVLGGAAWLLRMPAPTPEASLPMATGGAPGTTLPPPTTATDGAGAPSIGSMVPATTIPSSILVHVAGAVAQPGVHSLSPFARVADAVDAAGGAVADADLDGLNLAAPLADGQRVYVPRLGEVDPATVPSGAPAVAARGDAAPAPSGPVDINVATNADLEALPGVGPATAAAIVDDRARNGPFATVDDLDRVSGIGPAKLAALRDLVTV